MHSITRSTRTRRLASSRGSVLIVALLFSLGIAIALGSFLRLATGASQLSYRTHHLGVAMNIAETGLEQAMWEINNTPPTWSGWDTPPSGPSTARRRTFDLGTVEGGATAVVKVYAQDKIGTDSAYIIARSIVTPPQGTAIEKWVKVTLDRNSSLGIGGLGKDGIISSGNQVVMGSWNSDPDNDPSTPPEPYSSAVANDEMSLATIALDATLNSGNADINGKAAVGADSTDAIEVGPQGYIGPFGTSAGTKDPDSISTNFSADIPVVSAPSGTYTDLGTINSSLTLPRAGDTPNADGIYYYSATEITLSGSALSISPGNEVVMNVTKSSGDAITLSGGGGAIQVEAALVTNTVTGATTYNSASLQIYTSGNVKISGQGSATNVITTQNYTDSSSTTETTVSNVQPVYGKGQQKNTVIGWSYTQTSSTDTTIGDETTTTSSTNTYKALIESGATEPVAGTTTTTSAAGTYTDTGTQVGQPINLQIYGTRSDEDVKVYGTQTIAISGNGNLSAVVYAPNADISAKGGGNSGFVYGSLIGNTLTFTGNDCFYFDESLRDAKEGSRFTIQDWDEMVSYVDRQAYGAYMTF